jgi:hypothetical protein
LNATSLFRKFQASISIGSPCSTLTVALNDRFCYDTMGRDYDVLSRHGCVDGKSMCQNGACSPHILLEIGILTRAHTISPNAITWFGLQIAKALAAATEASGVPRATIAAGESLVLAHVDRGAKMCLVELAVPCLFTLLLSSSSCSV